jgi:hypothetical protein
LQTMMHAHATSQSENNEAIQSTAKAGPLCGRQRRLNCADRTRTASQNVRPAMGPSEEQSRIESCQMMDRTSRRPLVGVYEGPRGERPQGAIGSNPAVIAQQVVLVGLIAKQRNEPK